jgi:hypothetical protein
MTRLEVIVFATALVFLCCAPLAAQGAGCGVCTGTQQPGGGGVTWTYAGELGQPNAFAGTCNLDCSWQSCRFKGTVTVSNGSGVTIDVCDSGGKQLIAGLANGQSQAFDIDEKPGCGNGNGSRFIATNSATQGFVSDVYYSCTACLL